jgi:hypothetical protein
MKKHLFSVLSFLILCVGLQAQTNIANYKFASSVGTYVPLSAGATTLFTGAYDNQISAAIPLGGNFTYGTVTYTACFVSANGFITFGSAPGGTNYTPLSSGTYSGAISAFGQDAGGSTVAGATPLVSYENIGGATGEFVVQYADHANYSNRAVEKLNFQIRLNLATGAINIVYGSWTAPGTTNAAAIVGIRGNSTTYATNVNNLNIVNVPTGTTCTWDNAVTAVANNSTMFFSSTNTAIVPSNGLTYNWTPPVNAALAPVRTFSAVAGITTTGANLSWTAPVGASQYNVQYRIPGTCSWTNFAGNPVTTNSVALTGLAGSTVYQARVQSSDGTNNAIWSHIPNPAGTGGGYNATGTFSTLASCPVPTGLNNATLLSTSSNFTWTAGGSESAWDVYYGSSPLTAPTATTIPTVTTSVASYSATGLTAATAYSVYVRANCGAGDLSSWTIAKTFTTPCNSTNIPYIQDFESVTVPAIPGCTSIQNAGTGNNWVTSSPAGTSGFNTKTLTYNYSTPNAANAWFYTQGLNLTGGTSYRLTYNYANRGTFPEKLKVNYGNAAVFASMTSTLTDHPAITSGTIQTSVVDFIPATTGIYYIGFNAYSIADQFQLFVDNITVELTPTCFPPTALTTTNVATITTDLSWTAPTLGTPANYNWEVRTSGAAGSGTTGLVTSGNVIAPTTSVAISGLTPLTSYSVYVRSDCGASDFSVWSAVKTFTTLANCPVPTGVTVANTPTTAVATWTAGASETAWDVYYGATPLAIPSASTAATATTSSTSFTLTGITPSTGYAFYVRANCGSGNMSIWSPVNTFTTPCLPPNILTANGSARCGTGATTLTATADMGGTLNWFANSTGGSAIGSGTLFTTPTISATTNYYVSATGALTSGSGARTAPVATANTTPSDYGLVFDATKNFTLTSVDVFPTGAAGNLVVNLTNSTGAVLQTTTVAIPTGTIGAPYTVPLNFSVSPGTGYRLMALSGPSMIRESSLGGFPYALGNVGNITSGYISGTSTTYYFFYNWQFVSGCESARSMVTATVNTAPVLSVTSGTTICANVIKTLNVTSTLSDYDSYVWSPVANLYTDAAATTPYTGGSASTLYYSSATTNNSNYTVNSSNTISGCVNTTSVGMSVTIPSIVASANPTIVCSGASVNLNATGIAAVSGTIAVGNATTVTTATGELTAFCNRRVSYRMQSVYTAAELTALGLSSGNITSIAYNITTIGDAATNALYTVKMGTTSVNAFTDFISNTGFTTVYNPATYTHSVGINTINFNTPYTWDGVSNIAIEVTHDGIDNINNAQTYYTATTGNMIVYSFDGNATGTPSLNRLNIIINGQKNIDNTANYTWQWNPGAVNSNTTTVIATNTGSTTTTESYTVTALDPASTCTNSAVVNFSVLPIPMVTAATSNTTVCAGSTATLTAGGATNYTWTAAGTASTQVVTPTAASIYTVTGETAGCSNTATVAVGVNAIPVVTAIASQTLLCDDASTGASILTASTTASTYSWSNGATTMTTSVTPTSTVTYTVTVTELGCSADAFVTVTVSNCNGVKELVANGINIYPNPTNGILNIAISSELAGITSIEMYDAIGKLVIKETLSSETNTINTSKLTDGIYVFKIVSNNQAIKIGKIVKQ